MHVSGRPGSEQKQSSPPLHSSSDDTERVRFLGCGGLQLSFPAERALSDGVPNIDWMVKLEIGAGEHLLPLSSELLILAS